MGSEEVWDLSESALKKVLEGSGFDFRIDPGAGVFYGPKIDFKVNDAMRREWQLGTIQLDFSMPERFDLLYTATSGERLRPVMIHRAMLGSIERFLGVYIEHTAGAFPLWLAPVQVKVVNVNDSHIAFCEDVARRLKERGYRVEPDFRNETIGYKIREGTLEKVPLMIIIGDREIQNSDISVRDRKNGDMGNMSVDSFLELLENRVKERD
jgi:threonyl-tRNA synthetase